MSIKISNSKMQDKLLIANCVIILIIIILRDVVGISTNKYVLLVACCGLMPFYTYSSLITLLSFEFSLTFGIPSTYVYLIAAVVLTCKKKMILNLGDLCVFTVFLFWESILSIVYQSTYPITNYIGYFSRLFLLIILCGTNDEKMDYKKPVAYYTIGILAFIAIVLCIYLKDYSIDYIFNGRIRIGDTSRYTNSNVIQEGMQMSTNINNVAYFCITGMICAVVNFYKIRKNIWFVVLFAIFIMGTLTVSKTFFFLSALVFSILFFYTISNNVSIVKKLLFIVVFLSAVVFFINSSILNTFILRFSNNSSIFQDARSEILRLYISEFSNNVAVFFFGAGAFMTNTVLNQRMTVHSGIAQIIFSYGIVGGTLFITYLFMQIRSSITISRKSAEWSWIYITPVIIVILFTQTIQFLNPSDLILPLIVASFCIRIPNENL